MTRIYINNNAQKSLDELDKKYDEKEQIESELQKLMIKYNQINEDIELLQSMFMHQTNKEERQREYNGNH